MKAFINDMVPKTAPAPQVLSPEKGNKGRSLLVIMELLHWIIATEYPGRKYFLETCCSEQDCRDLFKHVHTHAHSLTLTHTQRENCNLHFHVGNNCLVLWTKDETWKPAGGRRTMNCSISHFN